MTPVPLCGYRPMPSIPLNPTDRQAILGHYRRSADPDVRFRAHILLLLDAGHPWATICAVLFCSSSTVSRWKRRFEIDGADAVLGRLSPSPTGPSLLQGLSGLCVVIAHRGDEVVRRSAQPDPVQRRILQLLGIKSERLQTFRRRCGM